MPPRHLTGFCDAVTLYVTVFPACGSAALSFYILSGRRFILISDVSTELNSGNEKEYV